jgi:hypothetical protein
MDILPREEISDLEQELVFNNYWKSLGTPTYWAVLSGDGYCICTEWPPLNKSYEYVDRKTFFGDNTPECMKNYWIPSLKNVPFKGQAWELCSTT